MKALGLFLVLLGAACFVLPLFRIYIPLLMQLGDMRILVSVILILIGTGLFFFSSYE